jgi:hypothetical protein
MIAVPVGQSNEHVMLLSICEGHENRHSEGHVGSVRGTALVAERTVCGLAVFTARYELSRET